MKWMEEFKAFIRRGNVVDLAVGVVVGGAFGKITTSLINDVVMPPIGLLLGGINFRDFQLVLKRAPDGAAAVAINYGVFISTVLDFLIIASAIFMVIKAMNRLKHKQESAPAAPSAEVALLTEIRDLLKSK
jgi:large conductance mechanosensitive channel